MIPPPVWLTEFQGAWTSLLTSPLDASSGTFRERREVYPEALKMEVSVPQGPTPSVSTDDRLALYHQQYWMRLFTTLQGHLPRFALSVGYWHFNHLASLHLQHSPPRHFDLERIADGLAARVEAALNDLENGKANQAWVARLKASRAPNELLQQALWLDVCERRVFEAPFAPRWAPTASELAALATLRLRVAPALELVVESWDLIAHSSLNAVAAPTAAPRRLAKPRHWALFRTTYGVSRMQLSAPCAKFLELCRRVTFGQALAELESLATPQQLMMVRRELPQWIQLALTHHWWLGAQ